ncbi:hypothetical protein D3C81_2034910 [compost metagenome]
MGLQLIKQGNIGGGDTIHGLSQQVCTQFVSRSFADQPQVVLGEPSGGARLVELEFVFDQMA